MYVRMHQCMHTTQRDDAMDEWSQWTACDCEESYVVDHGEITRSGSIQDVRVRVWRVKRV